MHVRVIAACLLSMGLAIGLFPEPVLAGSDEAIAVDELVVLGMRRAYQGEFEALEIPQAEQVIDAQTLRDAGALDLDRALD
jgi:iron complex outermembrane recepter protein